MSHDRGPTYYRTVGDADLYFANQLYATDWTGASAADKALALLAATRAVDSLKLAEEKSSVWAAREASNDELTAAEVAAAEELQLLEFPRGGPLDEEVWIIRIDAANGTYSLNWDGVDTGAINHDDVAATIQAALEALADVDVGELVVSVETGGSDGVVPYRVTDAADGAHQLSATDIDLVGGTGITVEVHNDNVPDEVFFAVCEEAKSLLSGRLPEQEFRNLVLTSDGVGSTRVSSDRSQMPPEHSSHFFTSPLAWKYLRQFVANNNTFGIVRTG